MPLPDLCLLVCLFVLFLFLFVFLFLRSFPRCLLLPLLTTSGSSRDFSYSGVESARIGENRTGRGKNIVIQLGRGEATRREGASTGESILTSHKFLLP